jgi:hypothetical protein
MPRATSVLLQSRSAGGALRDAHQKGTGNPSESCEKLLHILLTHFFVTDCSPRVDDRSGFIAFTRYAC